MIVHRVVQPHPYILSPSAISSTSPTIIMALTKITVTAVASMRLSSAMIPQTIRTTPRPTAQPHFEPRVCRPETRPRAAKVLVMENPPDVECPGDPPGRPPPAGNETRF